MGTNQIISELEKEVESLKISLKQSQEENYLLKKEVEAIKENPQRLSELIENEKRLNILLNTMFEGVALNELVFDDKGDVVDYRILDVNSSFEVKSGLKSSEVIGKLATDIYKMDSEYINEFWCKNKNATQTITTDLYITDTGKWSRVSTSPLSDNKFVTIFFDITDIKESEVKLHESEGKFMALIENSMDAVFINENGFVSYVNKSGLKLLGLIDSAQIVGRHIKQLFHESYHEIVEERIKKMLVQNISVPIIEEKIIQSNGNIVDVEVAASPFAYNGRKAIFVHMRDISDRKVAEKQLSHSHDLMRYIIEHDRSAVAIHDRDLNYIYVSQSYLNQYNVKEKDIIGRRHYDIFPDLPQKWRDVHQKALQGIVSSAEDDPYEREDGSVEWTRWECRPWYESSGAIGGIVVYTEIITERKRMEIALKESEEKWRSLFEILPVGVSIVNKDNHISDCNRALSEILDISQKDLLAGKYTNRRYLRADSAAMLPEEFPSIRAVNEKKVFQNVEIGIVKEDEKTIWTSVSAAPLANNQTVTVTVDITEGKEKLEEIKRNKERWKSLFNNSPSSIAVYESIDDGNDFIFTDFNDTAQKTDRLTCEKVVGKSITELFPAAKELGFLDILRKVWLTGKTEYMQPTFYSDGRIEGWRENIIYRLNTGEVVAIYSDISKRINAEIKLKHSEQKFKSLFENAADPILLINLEGDIIDANPATSLLLGYTHEEIVTLKTFDLDADESRPKAKERIKTLIKEGNLFFETAHFTKNGEILYFETNSRLVEFDEKKLILSVYRDITEKRKAEVAIKESEEQLSVIFNNAPAIMILMNEHSEILRMNRLGLENNGIIEEEVYGLRVGDALKCINSFKNPNGCGYSNDCKNCTLRKTIDKTFKTGHGYFKVEASLTTQGWNKNRPLTVLVSTSIVSSEPQMKVLVTIDDITKRKELENDLLEAKNKAEENEKKLMESQAMAKLGGWELDIEMGVFTFTDNFYKIFHTNANEMGGYQMTVGEYASKFVHSDDSLLVAEEIQKTITTTDPNFTRYVEHRIKYKDGGVGYIGVRYYIVKDSKGKTIKAYGVNQDITRNRLAEHQLRVSEQRLSTIYNNTTDMLCLIEVSRDQSMRYISINKTYLEAGRSQNYTLQESDFMNKEVSVVLKDVLGFDKSTVDSEIALLKEVYTSKINKNFIRTIDTPVGIVYLDTNLVPILSSEEVCTHILWSSRDITELKQKEMELVAAKEKAEESDKLKSAFLANISHEIRTPMNGIIGFSEMLVKPNITEEKRKHFSNIIIEGCQQLLAIVNDVLDISKIETGQVTVIVAPVNINTILRDVFLFFKPTATKNNISLFQSRSLKDSLANINTDKLRLKQILTNLVGNAIKFTKQGYVEYGYNLKGNKLEFFIKDSGIGIRPELQHAIFDRFRQAETSNTRSYGGAGLGLSISKALVELLGGEIWLESEYGKGTTFYFTIPYNSVVQESCIGEEISSENRGTILVAEDEEINFLFLEELLLESNFKVLHAKNGQEAIDLVRRNADIQLILMDIKMPFLNGSDATREILSIRPDLPIIAQTAYALSNEIEKFKEIGFVDYLTKPINRDVLIKTINKYL